MAVAIMAAGKGTRLKSRHPKVLHEVAGKSILAHVIASATQVVPAHNVFVIIGHEADRVREAVAPLGVNFVLQSEQRGTGHALIVACEALSPYDQVLVLSGDAPLITTATIKQLAAFHTAQKAAMTLLSPDLANPYGYGRILRKGPRSAEVRAIVEEKSATPAQKKLREINSGFYVFSVPALYEYIAQLSTNNPHHEYYLTDMAALFNRAGKKVVAMKTSDASEVLGSNTRAEIVNLDARLRLAKCHQLMSEGVTIFVHPESCVIDSNVEIGADTVVGALRPTPRQNKNRKRLPHRLLQHH